MVYLDNSATTRQYDQVTEVMVEMFQDTFGNASSLHTLGVEAEKRLKQARKACAAAMGGQEEGFYFTSGGTEADNTVFFGVAEAARRKGKKIITTAVEHPAVLEPAKKLEAMGYTVEYIGVDKNCRLDIEALEAAMTEDTILLSVMGVNNETGTVMPIPEIGALKEAFNKAHGTQILLHCDAVQAFGKIPMDLNGAWRNVDLVSVSGHKIHGPKGIGGLYVRKGARVEPFLVGGGQEKGFRSGTENMPAIAGFGLAAKMAGEGLSARTQQLEAVRTALLEGIQANIPDVVINSPIDCGVTAGLGCPSVLNVSFLGTRGEVLLHTLEQDGIYVSTGSACSSHKKGNSHVLTAMGLSDKAIEGAIRFSFSEFTTLEDIAYVLDKLEGAVKRFRKLGSFR